MHKTAPPRSACFTRHNRPCRASGFVLVCRAALRGMRGERRFSRFRRLRASMTGLRNFAATPNMAKMRARRSARSQGRVSPAHAQVGIVRIAAERTKRGFAAAANGSKLERSCSIEATGERLVRADLNGVTVLQSRKHRSLATAALGSVLPDAPQRRHSGHSRQDRSPDSAR